MKELLAGLCPELNETQLGQFDAYYRLLTEWNARMNLTAITEAGEVAKKHFYDSLTAAPYIPKGAACIDVGTGAGFPGVPLLIARPDLSMTLLDALQKRLTFLDAVLKELGLSARLVHARAEDGGRDDAHRGKYDIALSRAVAGLPVLLELTTPFLKVGGEAICYKGDVGDELPAAAHAEKALSVACRAVQLPSDYGARTLVIAKKLAGTPKQYPRKAGTPAKSPL